MCRVISRFGQGEIPFTDQICIGPTDKIALSLTGRNQLVIAINGTSLIELVRRIELPLASWEGSPDHAGGYQWPPAEDLLILSRSFYGDPYPDYQHDDGRISTLGCGACGLVECNSIAVRILVLPDQVIWDQFRQRCRPKWNYSGLAFRFERLQYDAAIESIRCEIE